MSADPMDESRGLLAKLLDDPVNYYFDNVHYVEILWVFYLTFSYAFTIIKIPSLYFKKVKIKKVLNQKSFNTGIFINGVIFMSGFECYAQIFSI